MPSKTKVALILPSLRGGGAERVTVTLANALVEQGFDVDLILLVKEGPYLSNVDARITVIELGARNARHAVFRFARYLRKHRPSSLLATPRHIGIMAWLAIKLSNSDARLVIREANSLRTDADQKPHLKKLIYWWLYKRACRAADEVVAVSEHVADQVRKEIGRDKAVTTIYNPVNLRKIDENADVFPSLPWDSDQRYVISVGRMVPQKNFAALIEAFARISRDQDLKLVILGEGDERENLQRLTREKGVENDTYMPGFVSNPHSYVKHAAVFVLPSIWEGLPNALLEAMACGTKVIATDCPGGNAEILEHGKWGLLVPSNDSNALAEAICASLKSPDAKNPRERANAFNAPEIVEKYKTALALGPGL